MAQLRVAACVLGLCWGCAHQAAAPVAPSPAAPTSSTAFDAQVSGFGSGTAALDVDSEPVRAEEPAEDPSERQLKLAQARAGGCGVGLR